MRNEPKIDGGIILSCILSCQLTKVNEVPLRVVEGWKHDDLHRETIYIAVVLLLASMQNQSKQSPHWIVLCRE